MQADVQSDFFHSLGEHTEVQQHAPANFDYDDAINRIQVAEAGLGQVPTNTAAIAANTLGRTDHTTSLGEHADELDQLSEFFEADAQDDLTGKNPTRNQELRRN